MKNISVERVKVYIDLPIVALLYIDLQCKINEHAVVKMKLSIESQKSSAEILEKMIGQSLRIDEVIDEENGWYRRLFCGSIKSASITHVGDLFTIMISGISNSDLLDREKKSRSFQNLYQTYNSVVQKVMSDTKDASFQWKLSNEQNINRLIVQYEESDWEFVKRIASHMHTFVIADEKNDLPSMYVGVQKKSQRDWKDETLYVYEKGIEKQYQSILDGNNSHNDFLYYSFRSEENYDLCDWFTIEGESLIISSKKAIFERGELLFSYKVQKEASFWQSEKYNYAIKGVALDGRIKKTKEENIYVQLDIDEEENSDYAFLWEPVYGNIAYCMPECGEQVKVYFPSEDEREANVIHTVRKNSYCEGFEQYQNRIFTTNQYKQMRLYPNELSLESKEKDSSKNLLELKDYKGISLKSPKKIALNAEGNITFHSEKVFILAPQEVRGKGSVSSLQIMRDFNIYSPNRIENCGDDSYKSKPVATRVYRENKNWINNYNALASIPAVNLNDTDNDGKCMYAMGAIPVVSDGKTTISMSDVLDGKKAEDTSFPFVFSSMQNRTLNGGYPPPKLEE